MTQSVPILDAILHPPLGAMQREIIPGLFTGAGDFQRNDGHLPPWNNVNAYGMTWTFVTVPAGFGFQLGSPIVFDERMLQVSTVHTDFAGHDIISEYHEFHVEGIYWLWANVGPTRVHVEAAPGLSVQLYWLVVHP